MTVTIPTTAHKIYFGLTTLGDPVINIQKSYARVIRACERMCRAVHNLFHLEGGGGGGVAISLAEVENVAALQSFTLGGSGACSPRKFFCDFRCSEAHSEAYREEQRAS